jgi:transcriptional regulator with XRE-family HTH domain
VANDENDRGHAFAKLIRDARKAREMTQEQVIEGSGVSKTTLIRWESGRAERPDPEQVRMLCRFLGIDPRQAAVALGYLTAEDLGPPEVADRKLDPSILEVIQVLEDPSVPEAEKQQWIKYLLYLREQSRRGRRNAG